MTGWISDVCNCHIIYSDDGNFTILKVINQCNRHKGLKDKNHQDAILADCAKALRDSGVVLPITTLADYAKHEAQKKIMKDGSI